MSMGITQETRREGYNRALSAITPRQALIISALRTGPMTAAEVADKLGFGDLNAVRPRLNELEKMEIVHVIDKRINPHSGINNAVYELKREAGECCTQ
jgi:predicted ArsR family transcriptional regulator